MPRDVGAIRPLDDRPHRWARTLREVSLDHADADGAPLRRHVASRVLDRTRGWALLAMAYQDWHVGRGEWASPRYRLARLQRYAGGWRARAFMPLSEGHVAALGGSVAELSVDVRARLRGLDPRDRNTPLARTPLTFLEHPGAGDDEEVAWESV